MIRELTIQCVDTDGMDSIAVRAYAEKDYEEVTISIPAIDYAGAVEPSRDLVLRRADARSLLRALEIIVRECDIAQADLAAEEAVRGKK